MPTSNVLDLSSLRAPLALCSASGMVLSATDDALDLFIRAGLLRTIPTRLPESFWNRLSSAPLGTAVEWRPPGNPLAVVGCTRYAAGADYLVLMKDVRAKQAAVARRLHQQRLESTGRLVASIAHELRNSVSTIVYSADLLRLSEVASDASAVEESVQEILEASHRLQATVAGLLDYARLGPTIAIPVSLRDVLNRSEGFLRSRYRAGAHELVVTIAAEATWALGNPITIEQIFVNLLLNAAESSDSSVRVEVLSDRLREGAHEWVRVRVRNNGPGIPDEAQRNLFAPFFTTKPDATGLGLTSSRHAAESMGGKVLFDPTDELTCFSVLLPPTTQPDDEGTTRDVSPSNR